MLKDPYFRYFDQFCFAVFWIRTVVTRHRVGVLGSRSRSGYDTDPIDERLHELIATEVTRGILDATPVIFGTVKEGMMEIMKERIRSIRVEIASSQVEAPTPLFKEFKACGAPEFFNWYFVLMRKMWGLSRVCWGTDPWIGGRR